MASLWAGAPAPLLGGDPKPTPQTAEAGRRLADILTAALRAYGLEDSAAIHAARCLRAAIHGFAVLKAQGGFAFLKNWTTATTRWFMY